MKKKFKRRAVFALLILWMLTGCEKKEEQGDELFFLPLEEEEREPAAEIRSMEENGDAAGNISEEEAQYCVVHICGAVEKPGVYTLEAGSRIYQAVERAGGFREDAAFDYLNQADLIADGMKLYIPVKEEVEDAGFIGAFTGTGSIPQESTLVNINTADEEGLCTLPGIGSSKAKSIIAYREANGSFRKVEDIMNVEGIKEGLFQKLKDSITV